MSDDNLQDLKEYIDGRISQSEENTKYYIDSRISQSEFNVRQDIRNLETKMDSGFAGVAEAIEQIHTELSDHDKRIAKLEPAA